MWDCQEKLLMQYCIFHLTVLCKPSAHLKVQQASLKMQLAHANHDVLAGGLDLNLRAKCSAHQWPVLLCAQSADWLSSCTDGWVIMHKEMTVLRKS